MKRLLLLVTTSAVPALAQGPLAPPDPALLPDARKTIELREGERNPFGQAVVVEESGTPEDQTQSEESRLRRILGTLRVSAISGSDSMARVLLGPMILRKGAPVPRILRDQQEQLTVESISKEKVVIAFVEKDTTLAEPRRIIIPVTLDPVVQEMLSGEAVEKLAGGAQAGRAALPKLPLQGVEQVLKGAKDADLQNLTSREFELMAPVPDETKSPGSR